MEELQYGVSLEAPSIFQDDFRFIFQSCKIRIGLKGYECRMVP